MTGQRDQLKADDIRRSLTTQIIGRNVLYYPSVASTMDVARAVAITGAAEGTVVGADEQTAGRGRLRRQWLAPSGNIAVSVILYPQIVVLPSLIMLASLAVVHAIETTTGLKATIKWPNDVLINERKVCGILIEADARPTESGRATYAIIGIGINVNLDPARHSEIESTATSLSLEAGRTLERLPLIRRLVVELDRLYLDLKSGVSLYEEWRDRLLTLGKSVTVTSVEGSYDAVAESVDRDGSLLVRPADGSARRVVAGDVTLKAK